MATDVQRSDAEKQKIMALLKKMHLFKGLDDHALALIIARLVTRPARSDERIFAEGEFAESFFIILEGKVVITRDVGKGEVETVAHLVAGDYFGEVALLKRTLLRTGTARAETATVLLEMNRLDFQWMLTTFPVIHRDLLRIAKGYELARRKRFKWLQDDETIHVLARRDEMILVYRLVLPVVLVLMGPVGWYVSRQWGFGLFQFAGALGALAGLLWAAWVYFDWENDFYIVTDKRVVYVEKIVLLYDSLQEAPLETIQTVNVSSANFIERWLGYGNVTVETFGGRIHMQFVRDPGRIEVAIKEYWERVTQVVQAKKEEEIRLEVRQRLGLAPPPKPVSAPGPAPARPAPKKRFLEDLFKIRVVENGVITYRKHWFILVAKTWLVLAAVIAMIVAILARLANLYDWLSVSQLFYLFAFVFLALLPYAIYQYLDWRDDRYQLTSREVIDLERKPFQAEIRDSAPLENILSIQHKRDTLLKLLLNFGTVAINAGNKELTFDNIYDPAAVQKEIFEYRLRRVTQIQADRDRGNREYVEKLVDLYAEYLPEYLASRTNTQTPPEGKR